MDEESMQSVLLKQVFAIKKTWDTRCSMFLPYLSCARLCSAAPVDAMTTQSVLYLIGAVRIAIVAFDYRCLKKSNLTAANPYRGRNTFIFTR